MYKMEKSFNVIKGVVPDFSSGDVTLAFSINGVKTSDVSFPNQNEGFTKKDIKCDGGVEADWDDTTWSLKLKNSNNQSRIKCTIDFNAPIFSTYLKSKVTNVADGASGLIVQTHEATDQTGESAKTDYRYIGANPNNYVCLEENGECSENNLYRIIGIIPTQSSENGIYEDRVKLIKYVNYSEASWYGHPELQQNNWISSELNTNILNEEFWGSIKSYQTYIDIAKWYLGETNLSTVTEFYKAERGNSVRDGYSKSTNTKIGLIYASDYGYATSGSALKTRTQCMQQSLKLWNNESDNSSCVINNWIFSKNKQWFLTTTISGNPDAWYMDETGQLWNFHAGYYSNTKIYPSFYLKSKVLFQSGNGTQQNPYRIFINENQ